MENEYSVMSKKIDTYVETIIYIISSSQTYPLIPLVLYYGIQVSHSLFLDCIYI